MSSLAAIFHSPQRPFELRGLATPEPKPGEILVEVLGCTVCGSDLHSVAGDRAVPVPTILGHEIVGRIEAFGHEKLTDAGGAELHVGDRVTWSVVVSCGQCVYCRRDLPQKCVARRKYGHEALSSEWELSGGFAQHCLLVPGTAVFRLPESLSLAAACPASCATATAMAAIEAAGTLDKRVVVVIGAGMLGVTACAIARQQGADEVICVDPSEERRQLASRFGATRVVEPKETAEAVKDCTEKRGADVVLEFAGGPAAFQDALALPGFGGRVVLVGSVFPTPAAQVHVEQIVLRNVSLYGVHNYAPRHLQQAIEFLASSSCDFAGLVEDWYPLSRIQDVFESREGPRPLRIGILPAE